MSKIYKFGLGGTSYEGILTLETPGSNGLLLSFDAEDGEPIAVFSSTIDGLAHNEIAIKNYSENEGIYEQLIDQEVILPAHRTTYQAHVSFGICYLHPEFINAQIANDIINKLGNERDMYCLIDWPDSQEYMEKEWFQEEAVLHPDKSSAYFIPLKYLTNVIHY
jgi:hypothetical protein